MNDAQAKAVLLTKLRKMLINSVTPESVLPDGKEVRESILNSLSQATGRITLDDGTLVVLIGNQVVLMKARTVGATKLIDVTGHFNGSEECDGEDAGDYTFWMNASSIEALRQRLTAIPRVAVQQVIMQVKV